MTEDLALEGCRSQPLGSYLKALGVLRLVGEQFDRQVKGHWRGDTFAMSGLDGDALTTFFLDDYRPTPLVAPWNGGSGFGPKDAKGGIDAITGSTTDRLKPYRETIAEAARLWGQGLEKDQLVVACRSGLPDAAVAWIDAAIVLSASGPNYPPLLGTGGNSGRLEFSNNFMQRLRDVLGLATGRGAPGRAESKAWLLGALFDVGSPRRLKGAVGQFDPGGAGGVNAAPDGPAESLVNPWDLVLLLEGSLLFASAVSRRLGSDQAGKASMPFMVDTSAVGYASSAAGEAAKGELWAPIWDRPASVAEIARLLGEGRAAWNGRQARTGVDMARAMASLGVDRGVGRFVRHAFVERLGQSVIAVPVGEFLVKERPQVNVLADLDGWIERLGRSSDKPTTVAGAFRRLEASLFEVARRGGPLALQDALVAMAEAELAVGEATSFRKRAGLHPIKGLDPDRWLPQLDDASPELRLAAALALGHDHEGNCLRFMLRPLRPEGNRRRLVWTDAPPRVRGLGRRPVVEILAEALVWRSRTENDGDDPSDRPAGVRPGFPRGPTPADGDVALLAAGGVDEARLGRLLLALLLLDPLRTHQEGEWKASPRLDLIAEPLWSLLVPFFTRSVLRVQGEPVELVVQPSWPSLLAADRLTEVASQALLRLRMARLHPLASSADALGSPKIPGSRLAAALLCPTGRREAQLALLRSIDPDQGERS